MKKPLFLFPLLLLLALVSASSITGRQPEPEEYTSAPPLEFSTNKTGKYTDIFAKNLSLADVTIWLDMERTNVQSTAELPLVVSIPPETKIKVTRMVPIYIEKKWSYRYHYTSAYGSPDLEHEGDYLYRLPYSQGKSYRVGQSFGGTFSHQEGSHFSVDFNMPAGSEVCAAREGVIVATRSASKIGGKDEKFIGDSNFINIRHADGTIGAYAHLMQDGVKVAVGDSVSRGQVIGLSGNTGWSSGPHLHFSVRKISGRIHGISCPVIFDSEQGPIEVPVKGRYYVAR